MNDEILTLAIDILDKLGVSTDAAGAATLFAHMAEIEARLTAARAGKLDNALLNTTWTDARAGKLDLIGATGDAASSTGNILQRMAEIFVRIGTTNDAANVSGNLHQRVAELLNRLTVARAGYIDTIETRTYNLDGRLTSARAGYLDKLQYLCSTNYADTWDTETVHGKLGRFFQAII